MFNYQQCIIVTVITFCLIAVLPVTAANTVATTQFIENPWTFFSPSLAQSGQYADTQFTELPQLIHLHTARVVAPSYTNLWDFSFDLTGKPYDYRKEFEDRIQ